MFSIEPCHNAQSIKNYRANDERGEIDYLGEGWQHLGYDQAAMDRLTFNKLIDNINPADGKTLTLRNDADRICAFHIIMAPIKGWQMAEELSPLGQKMYEARRAVEEAVFREVVEPMAQARSTGDAWLRDTGNLLAERHSHFFSRPVDGLPMLYAALGGGDKARNEVDGWLSCHGTKIALSNSCVATGNYFSQLFGSSWQDVWSGGTGGGGQYSFTDDLFGRRQQGGPSMNWTPHWRPDVPVEEFTRLRRGGPPGYTAEGFCFQGGRLYENGRPWKLMEFRQHF